MVFNFKNNKITIILLLILLLISIFCYHSIKNNVDETFSNMDYNKYFKFITSDSMFNYYKLNDTDYKFRLKNSPTLPPKISDLSFSAFTKDSSYNFYKYIDNSNISIYNIKNPVSNIFFDILSQKNTVLNKDTINMLIINQRDDTNYYIYDLSNGLLSDFTMDINGERVIQKGKFLINTTISSETVTTSSNLLYKPNSILDQYLLQFMLTNGITTNNINNGYYNKPFYGNFESIMSNPSNPIINPINDINPNQYSNTLFHPNVTPMMQNNSMLNENICGCEYSSNDTSNCKKNKTNKKNKNSNQSLANNDMFNKNININSNSNSNSNTNSNSNSNSNSNTNSNSNFNNNHKSEIKNSTSGKLLNDYSGIRDLNLNSNSNIPDNSSGPRPLLADFSSFSN